LHFVIEIFPFSCKILKIVTARIQSFLTSCVEWTTGINDPNMAFNVTITPLFSMVLILLYLIALYHDVIDVSTAFCISTVAVTSSSRSSPTKLYEGTTTTKTTSFHTTLVILYHKPIGVVTTHASDDVLGRLNVYQDLLDRSRSARTPLPANFPSGWHSIGRLDAATSGILLLTNDGGLVHHVTNHRAATATDSPLKKTYEVVAMGYHDEDSTMFDQFRQGGVDIGNHQLTLPVQDLHLLDHPTAKTTRLSLSIIEGRNRQIRRMFHSCGSGVMRLSRTAIGSSPTNSITIDMVPTAGEWCILSDEMISSTLGWKPRTIQEFNLNSPKHPTRSSSSPRTMKARTASRQSKSHR
jgi:pseudouridine synthase